MNRRLLQAAWILAIVLLMAATAAYAKSPLNMYWKDGIRFESEDGNFKFKFGGRIMADWVFWADWDDKLIEAIGELEDGTEFRRARLYVSGEIYKHVEFKAQYDFGGGDTDFKDVYLGLKKIPTIGGVRVGHFKEPFSLEELTSSKYITFMERSLPSCFWPSRNTGIMVHNHAMEERLTWAVGVFKDADDFGGQQESGKFNITGRLTGLPVCTDDGEKLVHVGIGYSHRAPNEDTVRYRQRPEVHLSPRFVDTKSIHDVDSVDVIDGELACVFGPFSVQGEYTQAMLSLDNGSDDPDFSGWYAMGSWFLTGEHRRYKNSAGCFDR